MNLHMTRALVAFILLCIAVAVLAAGSGWKQVTALVLALFALVLVLVPA